LSNFEPQTIGTDILKAMKNTLILGLLIFGVACQTPKENAASEETVEVNYTSYGAEITADNALDIKSIGELMNGKDSLQVKLTGEIEKTCGMKGCWMTVKTADSTTMRVSFENYGFFVPKEGMAGKTTIVEGEVKKTVNTVETLRHFAQDEGKSAEEINAITEPQEEYTFVATGVLIKDVPAAEESSK
jgi:hypothetical protein